jgi:hypothetical protein
MISEGTSSDRHRYARRMLLDGIEWEIFQFVVDNQSLSLATTAIRIAG